MHLDSVLSVLGLVLSANAFLIPGDLSIANTKVSAVTAQNAEQDVTVDCATCPYALNSQRNGGHEWTNDVASDLNFKVGSDGETLRLNGVPFYPVQKLALPPQLHVSQKKKEGEDSTFEGFPGDLRLSYSLEYKEEKAEDGNSLLTFTMTILALDGQMVRIDDVVIKTVKDASGKLLLHSAVTEPQAPNAADEKCADVLCRVFSKIIAGVNRAKHAAQSKAKVVCHKVKCICQKCWKALTSPFKPVNSTVQKEHDQGKEDSPKLPSHHKFRPGMFGGRPHHGGHRHHHKGFFHRMAHVMWKAIRLTFMPILIGVAFGMAASAIGMLVGQLVVHLWMKYRRTEHVVYIPVDSDVKDDLPAYEDVPSVEVSVEKEGEDKA